MELLKLILLLPKHTRPGEDASPGLAIVTNGVLAH